MLPSGERVSLLRSFPIVSGVLLSFALELPLEEGSSGISASLETPIGDAGGRLFDDIDGYSPVILFYTF